MLALALAVAALVAPTAQAKDFRPGDLRLCDTKRCVAVMDRDAIKSLAGLYYVAPQPKRAATVRPGAPYYELRFRNGYVTGIVATKKLDRFLSYGVVLGRFRRSVWYRVPPTAAAELRRLSRALKPLRIDQEALSRSR